MRRRGSGARRALPGAAAAAGAHMPQRAAAAAERDGASGAVAERCRWRGRPLASPPRSDVPHVPYSPWASPTVAFGRVAARIAGADVVRASADAVPEWGVRRRPIRIASTNRTAAARTPHLLLLDFTGSFGTLTGRGAYGVSPL